MQDIHLTGASGGRFYGGGGGDRRLRPNHYQSINCPRCDSLNTKFCYYNNYNLSQPRHFCKSCRRYWTKGGILRNVPFGGGCRKGNRSKPKSSSTVSTTVDTSHAERKSNSHSSSESSSVTATTTAAATNKNSVAAAPEVVSGNSSNSNFPDFPESNFSVSEYTKGDLIQQVVGEGQIFQDIGNFTNLTTSSNYDPFHVSNTWMYDNLKEQWNQQPIVGPTDELKLQEMSAAGFFDQTAQVDELSGRRENDDGRLAPIDLQSGGGATGSSDQSFWCQTQWCESDHFLNYFP